MPSTATKTRKPTQTQAQREALAAELRAANANGNTDVAAEKEAALLNGVRTTADKPGAAKPTPKPAKADPKPQPKPTKNSNPKPQKTEAEKLLRPATKTVTGYVAWLKAKIGPAEWAKLTKNPDRLAEVSLQNYAHYQASKRSA